MTQPLWISEQDVVELLSLPEAIVALRAGLGEEAAGRAAGMTKTHVLWGDGATLHAIGAVFEGHDSAGAKVWAHTPGGASPLLIMFDANDGSLSAVIEAFALGQLRTGGISGVATDLLARPDATRMAMIGAGKQSLAQVAAVAAVRRLDRVTVWSPSESSRRLLAERIEGVLQLKATPAARLEAALEDADIVTLATRARAPFLGADALAPGTHLNAIGAITPERAEFEPALLDRATVIAADSVPQVRRLSREFMLHFGDAETAWDRVTPLSALARHGFCRPAGSDLTVFKAMGTGVSDVALGVCILRAARVAGRGRPLPKPVRATPRLSARQPIEVQQ